jgi:hypothetical protein
MNTHEVANRYVTLAREGMNIQIQEELFDENVECLEPEHSPNPGAKGKAAIAERLKQWYAGVEQVHDSTITGPLVIGNFFSVGMMMDMTMKGLGRFKMDELGVYEVKDGKIIREQYFY